MRKFYYISGKGTLTKQQVYNRFKNSVYKKYKRKYKKKKNIIYIKKGKKRFSLFIYNRRNGYRNRMKAKELKKLVTPKYFFSKYRKSDNKSLKILEKGFKWNNLPKNLLTHFNKKFKIKDNNKRKFATPEDKDFYLWKKYKWLTNINKKYTFIEYKSILKDNLIKKGIQEKKNKLYSIRKKFNKFNKEFNIRKKYLWVFQKIFIFFKSIKSTGKSYACHLNVSNILHYYSKLKTIYKYSILVWISFFNSFIYKFDYYKKVKWITYSKKIKLKFGLYFFLIFLIHFKKKLRVKTQEKVKTVVNEENLIIDKVQEEDFKNMTIWMDLIDKKPWMTFKDSREFNKKKNHYLDLNFNKNYRKKLLDWLLETEKRFEVARIAYKKKKMKNINKKKKW